MKVCETIKDIRKNETIFNKYFSSVFKNLNLKKDPKTLAEFGEICKVIKEKFNPLVPYVH